MSFCPTNDIHLVYLDNELPAEFKAEYEEHIKNCPQCQAELAKLQTVHSIFEKDARNITPDSHYLDQSFERLKVKMVYSKNVKHQKKPLPIKEISYIVTAAAAVVAFAFVIPFRVSSAKSAATTASLTVPYMNSPTNVSFDSGRSVVISGNIGDTVLSSVSNVKTQDVAFPSRQTPHNHDMIKDVGMLRPDFMEDRTISIKVTFPGMYEGPVAPGMPFPEIVVTGRFE